MKAACGLGESLAFVPRHPSSSGLKLNSMNQVSSILPKSSSCSAEKKTDLPLTL